MNNLCINNIIKDFEIELCNVNRSVIGIIDKKCIQSISRSILEIDNIKLSIEKYVYSNGKMIINPMWYEVKDERLICVNSKEYFVLKNNEYKSSELNKSITAYSLEYKLGKIDAKFEDIGIHLMVSEIENDIYSLNELLFDDTGWKLGHIDESVRYEVKEDGTKVDKLRWQESVNKRWYDYIKNDICDAFGCIPHYDTFNKEINLYDIKTYGENIELYLSDDNYIKDLGRISSSEDIVTRLYVEGNEEMDIIGATASGYPYVENYNYFINNNEMSDMLICHINKYNEMVEIRSLIWKNLIDEKYSISTNLTSKKMDLYIIYENIRAKKSIKESYDANNDEINSAIIASEITKLIDEQVKLEIEIKNMEENIIRISDSINEINILCKRETATDENGSIIFNSKTLNELKDFIYCDTYSNGCFLDVNDVIDAAERELEFNSYPTVKYTLDLERFISNVRGNGFNKNWNYNLGLGDIVILYDKDLDKESFLYVNGYTQYPNSQDNENDIDLELSNKKLLNNNIRNISDRLKESELSMKTLNRKMHLLNDHKYKRINMSREQVNNGL